jgi:hypothetical protein
VLVWRFIVCKIEKGVFQQLSALRLYFFLGYSLDLFNSFDDKSDDLLIGATVITEG